MLKKVLIVEDTLDIAEALRQLVALHGYEAIVANSGFEGVDLARERKPDLILMDVSMPDLDGIEAVRMIRTHDGSTPILAVTSYAEGHEKELIAAGCHEVFSKTTFIATFEVTLRKYLET